MDAITKFGEESIKESTLIDRGGLFPSTAGARVRLAGGKLRARTVFYLIPPPWSEK
ncbi:MAG: hypothetical protein ACREI2_09580 [Nitrospiraceae bacterium]